MKKIAFCYLLYDALKHGRLWEEFFADADPSTYSIYAHIKKVTSKTQKWLIPRKIKTVKTDYCSPSLVSAWIRMLEEALQDPDNKYFIILSGECIPLFEYQQFYKKITSSSKSRMEYETNVEVYAETGYYWASQWCTLNRKQAKLLIELRTTEEGRQFTREVNRNIKSYCADEIFPINWFIKKYGKPSCAKFKKEIKRIASTYTYWDGIHTSPKKFNKPHMMKVREKICESGAVIGRKFFKTAAKELGLSC